jgi:hypothetical protein
MMTRVRVAGALALAACLASCASQPFTTPNAVVTSAPKKVVAADRAKDAVAVGKSTRADVLAALGETLAISFDSGYEIWVYRLGSERAAEFVILFAPSGLVAKTRIRPAPRAAKNAAIYPQANNGEPYDG